MTNLEKARQAFGDAYSATPEVKGFLLTSEDEGQVIFAKNERALNAYRRLEKKNVHFQIRKRAIFFTVLAVVTVAFFLHFLGFEEPKAQIFLMAFIIGYLRFVVIHEIKHQRRKAHYLKKVCRKQVVFYDLKEKKFVEL